VFLAILFAALLPLASRPGPQWWEVTLNLKTAGEYKLDEGDSVFVGRYSFSIRWRGWLEKDDEDYLLYRLDCQVCDWKAQETASGPERTEILTADEVECRPAFNLKYFIRRDKLLDLDFAIECLTFPLSRAEEALPLLLPSSAQDEQREAALDYNSGVAKGSNRVAVEEEAIYQGPLAKKYGWSWKHQQWLLREQRTVFTTQNHDVEVALRIIPHSAHPK
jgi:hypothetical protein